MFIAYDNKKKRIKKEHTLRGTGSGRLAPWQRLFAHCHNTSKEQGRQKNVNQNSTQSYNELNTNISLIIIITKKMK